MEWEQTAWEYLPHAIGGASVVLTIIVVKYLFKANTETRNVDLSKYPRDKVTLCQIARGPWAPSMSPFPLKLETYLRMAKIPYQNEFGLTLSSKGKTPWMVCDGQEVADSQLSIQYLNQTRQIDLSAGLSDQEKAVAWAFQMMVEEHLYWPLVVWRWSCSGTSGWNFLKDQAFRDLPSRMLFAFRRCIEGQAHAQGMGRHTTEEVVQIGKDDLRALSRHLGEKPFLMGSEPCEADCGIFGILAQFYWHLPGSPFEKIMKVEFGNLGAYCERMKEKFWPDWDDCITHGGTWQGVTK